MISIPASLLSKASAAHALRIAKITTPLWVLYIVVFATAGYLDSSGAERDLSLRFAITVVGYLPWLVLAPIVVLIGFRQSIQRRDWRTMSLEMTLLAIAILGIMLGNLMFVMAPFWGTTIDVILSVTTFRDWLWDIGIFVVTLLSGLVLGAVQLSSPLVRAGIGGGKIMARSASRVDIVDIADVIAASAQGNYVALITEQGEFLHRATLTEMKEQLASHGFVQVHRSHLVRADSIASVTRADGRINGIHLHGGRQLPVSAGNQEQLKDMLRTGHAAA